MQPKLYLCQCFRPRILFNNATNFGVFVVITNAAITFTQKREPNRVYDECHSVYDKYFKINVKSMFKQLPMHVLERKSSKAGHNEAILKQFVWKVINAVQFVR